MSVPGLGNAVDERFLAHRLRSTSVAGLVGALTAGSLFLYRYYAQHRLDWDLFAVVAIMAAVKVGVLLWYRRTD